LKTSMPTDHIALSKKITSMCVAKHVLPMLDKQDSGMPNNYMRLMKIVTMSSKGVDMISAQP
jgi:hypothetical protein